MLEEPTCLTGNVIRKENGIDPGPERRKRLLIEVHGTYYFPRLRGEAMNGAKSILTSHRNNLVNEESHAGAIRAASIVA